MENNLIVLTNGLAGSSVLAGLLARRGYWLGAETYSKRDYDTYENLELVALNQQIFNELEYTGNYEMTFVPGEIELFQAAGERLDPAPYRAFLDRCEANGPWLWKDPRLRLTLFYWVRHLDLDKTDFILLTREPLQTWISTTLRRQIQTPGHCRDCMHGIRDCLADFLWGQGKPYLELVYEDLLLRTDETIDRINAHIGSSLTRSDLEQVFSGQLGRRQRGGGDFLKALMIYLKNYRQRYR